MSEKVKLLIRKNSPHFKKYKKYIKENDWTTLKARDVEEGFKGKRKTTVDLRLEEFNVQEGLIKAILERLKVAVKKCEGDHHLKIFKDFVKETLSIVSLHTDRADNYISTSKIENIEDVDLRANEIAFHNILFKAVSSIDDTVSALNIKEEDNTQGIQFLDTQKATISMHEVLVLQYPEIQAKLDEMGIDLVSPPPPTLHILNENPPKYIAEKNYWEQSKEVLQYWFWEKKKVDEGVTIDGYYIDGWLYFHFNHFVTNIPTTVEKGGIKENKDVVTTPTLRDNEILITNYFIKSKKESLMSLIAASRRVAKTTMNASRIVRAQILAKKQILCAGGSAEDLGHIHNNIEVCHANMNPAFRLHYLSPTEDGRGKCYGIKAKNNKSKVTCNVFIINLEGGVKKNKGESLAGFTPDEFILDEAMKFRYKRQLEALEPALWGAGVLRCNVLITGTGGDDDLAEDAIKMLTNPEGNRVCLMDWDDLEKNVPEEYITWQRVPYGLFLPTQCSIKHVKIKTNLADYLKIDSETLKKVPIFVTDWKKAKEEEDKEREAKIGDKLAYIRLLAYHPYDPSEIFLSGRENPFPVAEAKAHKNYLLQTGLWDRRRDLFRDSTGKIQIEVSNKELAKFPHKGGIVDAPFLIFEDPPTEKVKMGTFSAGFDDYAAENSETDSVSTFYVMKNKILGDPFSEKIVASISFRPERHQTVYEKWLLLMEAYQLEGTCFGENFNYAIKDYLDRKHLADKYLAQSLDFTQSFNLPNNLKRKTGFTPTAQIKKHLFGLFVDYCNEEFEVEQEDGTLLTLKGVQRIDDIGLLDEIISFNTNQNSDRIISASAVVSYVHFLNSSYRWKVPNYEQTKKPIENKKQAIREKEFYGTRNRSFYRPKRQ